MYSQSFPIDSNLHQIAGPEVHTTPATVILLVSGLYRRLNLSDRSMEPSDGYTL